MIATAKAPPEMMAVPVLVSVAMIMVLAVVNRDILEMTVMYVMLDSVNLILGLDLAYFCSNFCRNLFKLVDSSKIYI